MSDVETTLTRVLGGWGAGSVLVGGLLALSPRRRAFGRQTAAWGAVDLALAAFGAHRRTKNGPTDPARLRKVLLGNAALDVGYLALGGWAVRDGRWRGDGQAVLVQGGFLLLLDTAAASRLR